jgi:hypothetical protein
VCEPREQLLLLATLFPLLLFAAPGVAVYDGERLFLVSYPVWAVLIGRGAEVALSWMRQKAELGLWPSFRGELARRAILATLVLLQGVGVIAMHPCQLSYYNLLVGGLTGADRLGFERTYWGDSVTRGLLRETVAVVPEDGVIAVEPVLHQFQLNDLKSQSPILRSKRIRLLTADEAKSIGLGESATRIVFCRKAEVPPYKWESDGPLRARKVSRFGVLLSHQ